MRTCDGRNCSVESIAIGRNALLSLLGPAQFNVEGATNPLSKRCVLAPTGPGVAPRIVSAALSARCGR
jgi:hypothetical protein